MIGHSTPSSKPSSICQPSKQCWEVIILEQTSEHKTAQYHQQQENHNIINLIDYADQFHHNHHDIRHNSSASTGLANKCHPLPQIVQCLMPSQQTITTQQLTPTKNSITKAVVQNSQTKFPAISKSQKNQSIRMQLPLAHTTVIKQPQKPSKFLPLSSFPKCQGDNFESYRNYMNNIQKTQQINYPQITQDQYLRITTIWHQLQSAIKNKFINNDPYIKYGQLERLAPGCWLNDQIISYYLHLLTDKIKQKQYLPQQSTQNYTIFDSLKTYSIFQKLTYDSICRWLLKNNVSKYQNTLIFVINQSKHWFYITLSPTKLINTQVLTIIVYDSQRIKNQIQYKQMKTISKIIEFATIYYDFPTIYFQVCPNFPQQFDGSNCGVMMLCGIKDTVRNYLMWSFQHNHMNYKRALITKEIIDGSITGF